MKYCILKINLGEWYLKPFYRKQKADVSRTGLIDIKFLCFRLEITTNQVHIK